MSGIVSVLHARNAAGDRVSTWRTASRRGLVDPAVSAVLRAASDRQLGYVEPVRTKRVGSTVRRATDGRWHAVDAEGSLPGAHYATRKAAVELLVRRRNDTLLDNQTVVVV